MNDYTLAELFLGTTGLVLGLVTKNWAAAAWALAYLIKCWPRNRNS